MHYVIHYTVQYVVGTAAGLSTPSLCRTNSSSYSLAPVRTSNTCKVHYMVGTHVLQSVKYRVKLADRDRGHGVLTSTTNELMHHVPTRDVILRSKVQGPPPRWFPALPSSINTEVLCTAVALAGPNKAYNSQSPKSNHLTAASRHGMPCPAHHLSTLKHSALLPD